MKSTVKCPKCGAEIDVSEVLYHQIQEELSAKFEKESSKKEAELNSLQKELKQKEDAIAEEKSRLQETLNKQLAEEIEKAESRIEISAKKKAQEENSERLNLLEQELNEKSAQLKEFNKALGEIEKLKREKAEIRETILQEQQKEYQKNLQEEKDKFKKQAESELQSKLNEYKNNLDKEKEENREKFELMQNELNEKSKKLQEYNKALSEIEKLKREKDELQGEIEVKMAREYSEKLKISQDEMKRIIEQDNQLTINEYKKKIEDMKAQIDEAKRKAEQGSMQLQGEIQELALENQLRNLFRFDEISEVKKGQKGGDCIQTVRSETGMEIGKIYYESKRTKNFETGWIQKLKEDNLTVNADILVIATQAMPDGETKYLFKEGVWICSFWEVKYLAQALRYGLIQLQTVAITQQNKGSKMELLYNFLTSQEFRGQFEAIMDGFKELKDGYEVEKLRMQRIWKEREKQLDRILMNATGFYGSIKGIAGASIPDIPLLEGDDIRLLK
jgi:hypothetical protein